jgi:hypothetical protein
MRMTSDKRGRVSDLPGSSYKSPLGFLSDERAVRKVSSGNLLAPFCWNYDADGIAAFEVVSIGAVLTSCVVLLRSILPLRSGQQRASAPLRCIDAQS